MKRCCNFIKSIGVSVSDLRTKIEIPETTFIDGCCYRILVEQDIPAEGCGLPLFILNGETRIPIWQCGDARSMMTGQICQLKVDTCLPCDKDYLIPVEYVNTELSGNPDHFTVCRRLKPFCFDPSL